MFDHEILLGEVVPIGLVVKNDSLWVSDVKGNRFVILDLQGNLLKEYPGFQRPMHISIDGSKIFLPEFTTDKLWEICYGVADTISLEKKPDGIAGVAVKDSLLAVADFYNHRIIFSDGNKTTILGKEGHHTGELYYPTDVEIVKNKIYVADAYNNRVQVFSMAGVVLNIIGENDSINVATGIAVYENQIFVADFEGNRILAYDIQGKLKQTINNHLDKPTDIFILGSKMYVVNYGSGSVTVYTR